MTQRFFFLLFLLSNSITFGQGIPGAYFEKKFKNKKTNSAGIDILSIQKPQKKTVKEKDSILKDSINIDMYTIYTVDRDSSYIDTTLTIQKEYKMNFLRKDYFELLPFSNTGHAFNRIGYDFSKQSLLANLGARSKHFSYIEAPESLYFQVPTPLTELFYRTAFEQGRIAHTTITANLSPQFNFAFTYKGARSLGKYVNFRSAYERFQFSFKYQSLNTRYTLWGHYSNQSIENQENGGLDEEGILLFETGDPDFKDRSVLDVRFKTAESLLAGKRSFIDHHWNIVPPKDSVRTKLLIGHRFVDESRYYSYRDSKKTDHFGDLVIGFSKINDLAKLFRTKNQVYTEFKTPYTGKLRAGITSVQSNYFFGLEEEEVVSESIPNQIKTTQLLLNGDWKFQWKGFSMQANLQKSISGSLLSDEIGFKAQYEFPNKTSFTARASFRNQTPDFNFQLYKSDYLNYNWYNPDLENQNTTHFSFNFKHPQLGRLYVHWQLISNYTYFNTTKFEPKPEDLDVDRESILYVPPNDIYLAAPQQANNALNYFKIRYTSEFKLGNFAMTNTAQYQKVTTELEAAEDLGNSQPLNVPEWNLRTTLSFSREIFKKAMYLQTGFTGHYFTKYYADRYNPLLGDFTRQNDVLIGDFPRIDFFVNGKVQQTRLFLKAEHINTLLENYNYFSAPGYPYRDFVIRFGLVWNFFR